MITQEKAEDALGRLNQTRDQLLSEIRKGIIGQDEVIEELLVTLLELTVQLLCLDLAMLDSELYQ